MRGEYLTGEVLQPVRELLAHIDLTLTLAARLSKSMRGTSQTSTCLLLPLHRPLIHAHTSQGLVYPQPTGLGKCVFCSHPPLPMRHSKSRLRSSLANIYLSASFVHSLLAFRVAFQIPFSHFLSFVLFLFSQNRC